MIKNVVFHVIIFFGDYFKYILANVLLQAFRSLNSSAQDGSHIVIIPLDLSDLLLLIRERITANLLPVQSLVPSAKMNREGIWFIK